MRGFDLGLLVRGLLAIRIGVAVGFGNQGIHTLLREGVGLGLGDVVLSLPGLPFFTVITR